MNLRLKMLEIVCRRKTESVCLTDFSYFFGEIGSGKSTIARLIDYCLGGDLVDTPAIQDEFIAATLYFDLEGTRVEITREKGSNQVQAAWDSHEGQQQVLLPTRAAQGVVIHDTGVEILSDFIFYVAGIAPPRVRRSRERDNSDLKRLSFRNLFWYCYLDQDEIDSSFFHLGRSAEHYRNLDSKNVLRFIVGLHQEQVAELEMKLDEVRRERQRLQEASEVLDKTIVESGFSTEIEIQELRSQSDHKRMELEALISQYREQSTRPTNHAIDTLRHRSQHLGSEMEAVEETLDEMVKTIEGDKRHLNEIKNLTTKLQRVAGARAVLRGVEFQKCPRCAQVLPDRNVVSCSLCGQAEPTPGELSDETSQTRSDLGDRERELEEMIEVQSRKYRALRRRGNLLLEERNEVDRRLNDALKESDSAYLSAMLENERMLAEVHQELRYLDKIAVLPRQVAALKNKSDALAGDEAQIRTELLDARQKAESDLGNLDRLGELFLDCLVRASIPGFSASDRVEIGSPDFVPEVIGRAGELATSTFDNLGSGGKKTLFKCCFALAVHRLAAEIGGILPTLLILDSPMKNISERENRSQFEGFHQLLYELGSGELNGTQFILIDKELCPPPATFTRNFLSRHMTAGEETAPPLISYYRGIQEASEEEAQAGETEIEQHLEEEVGDEE